MKEEKARKNFDFQNQTNDEIERKIEFLSTDDDRIKAIGEILSNDTSRLILKELFNKEITANEISQKTGIRLSLVIYHLNKMIDTDLVYVSKTSHNSKKHEMKFYSSRVFSFLIMPQNAIDKAKESKSLINAFKRIYRFAIIGGTGITSWIISQSLLKPKVTLDRTGVPTHIPDYMYEATIITLIIILVGFIIERVLSRK